MGYLDSPAESPDLSICTTVKNRSRLCVAGHELTLFPNCVKSIVSSIPPGLGCELVVADWGSDDWPLTSWLLELAAPLSPRIIDLEGVFSRGTGRNAAAMTAESNQIFFLDADCLISEEVLQQGIDSLRENKAFFPIVYSFKDPQHRDGWWRARGYGNCMVSKDVFNKVGGFPEHDYWGREDLSFYQRVSRAQEIVREKTPGILHQWHPNDFAWKNRYGNRSPIEEAKEIERRQTAAAIAKIKQTISEGQSLILVDDGQLDRRLLSTLVILPFLERDGEFWGLPSDSNHAIAELERMRENVDFFAFAWTSFWWLEQYSEFGQYLRSRFRLTVRNRELLIFDLKSS